jgi:hypothetical protein
VAARQSVPVIGPQIVSRGDQVGGASQKSSWLSPERWQISIGYRWQHSHRHFVGTEEQHERAERRTEVNNKIHVIDVAGTYEVTPRFSLSFSVPMLFAERFGQSTPENATHSRGVGDISVVGRMWLMRPPSEARQNVSFGLGVKFPTGRSNVTDIVQTAQGPVRRNVDQSIQPGDGGYGMVLDFQAYKAIKSTRLYASGVYLINPRRTNGVLTGRSRASEAVMSVADQYLYRAGAVFPFPKVRSLAWSMSIRGEGVPSTDLIGKSDGFRRPGYAISVEPGLIFSRGRDSYSFSVPVAVRRNRTRSVPDILENRHGDAAFADYIILAGYSRRF